MRLRSRPALFTRVFVPAGIKRKKLSRVKKAMYRHPHPTPRSRVPVHVLPREILAAHELLSEVSRGCHGWPICPP